MTNITGYHAHIYYALDQLPQAEALAKDVQKRFGVQVGRLHEKPVGPHPRPSCQLSVSIEQFSRVIPWLMLHRGGLTIFVHTCTGNDLPDHTDHAIWMGSMEPLKLEIFGQP